LTTQNDEGLTFENVWAAVSRVQQPQAPQKFSKIRLAPELTIQNDEGLTFEDFWQPHLTYNIPKDPLQPHARTPLTPAVPEEYHHSFDERRPGLCESCHI